MSRIDLAAAAQRLRNCDAALILAHSHPDGDTLGSAYALAHALQALGKDVCVLCEDPVPLMFAYMAEGLTQRRQEETLLVCVDVADEHLLGKTLTAQYHGQVQLCIDHHATNTMFAHETFLEPEAAATAEMVSDVIDALGVAINKAMAACLYAGISTDTGCFRYATTTARSHRYAARYMELGVETEPLDRIFFETTTKTYLALERLAFDGLRFFCGGRVALIAVTQAMYEQSGSNEEEYIKLVVRTRQIEGVQVGVSIRERDDGSYKISLRSHAPINSAVICARLGGGGHCRASGCASELPLEETIAAIVRSIELELEEHDEEGV